MTPTPEDIALADSIVRRIVNHHFNGEAMFEMDISRRHADLPAAHYTALLIAAYTAPLRELAEIGRLAVEEEKLRRALKAKYLASGGKTDDCMGLYDTFFEAAVAHREAACAYLAKHPTP